MARFRGTVQGNRGEASRLGHKRIGVSCDCWDVGVDSQAYIDMQGNDVINVYATGGSNDGQRKRLIATVSRKNGNIQVETSESVTSIPS